jgi:hypothetical protein
MEKLYTLHSNLEFCFTRTPYYKHVLLPEDQQDEVCKREKEALVAHINSDEMNFESILKNELNKIYGIFKRSKKVTLAFTIQGSVLIFEEKINKKNLQRMSMKTTNFVNLEDRNYPLRFELSELLVVICFKSHMSLR